MVPLPVSVTRARPVMEPVTDAPLKKTPLHARHRASGAKMVPFGGWDMPLEYSGIADEHMAVRTRAGLFDVSHMGEIEIAGNDALAAVQRISSNDASKLQVGQAQYSGLLTPRGTFVDDLLVYRLAPQHFLLVVNAGNIETDFAWIDDQIKGVGDVVAVNASSRYALLAVQGPAALEVLQPLTGVDLRGMQVLLVRPRRGRERPRHGLADRLYRRGRLRGVRPAAVGRPRLAGDSRRRPSGRADPGRTGRARYAPARSVDAPLRPGHRRHDDAARSGHGLDRRLEEGRLHRRGGAAGTESPGREPQAGRLRGARPRHRPHRTRGRRRRPAMRRSSPAGRRRRS